MEAEIGGCLPAKTCSKIPNKPPGPGGAAGTDSPSQPQKEPTLPTLPASRTGIQYISVVEGTCFVLFCPGSPSRLVEVGKVMT